MTREFRPSTSRYFSAGAVLVLALAVTLAVSFASVAERPRRGEDTGLARDVRHYVTRIDGAVAAGRISLAALEWRDAYAVALASRQWANLVTVGDAAVEIGDATGTRIGWTTKARDCYRSALLRARAQGSVDGARAATQGFARLGDAEGVAQGNAIVASLASEARPRADGRDVAGGSQ